MRCPPRVLCRRTQDQAPHGSLPMQAPGQRGDLACNSRLYESQISKLSRASGLAEGQPNNRELNEPSRRAVRALRQSQFNWTQIGEIISVCSAELQLYMELSAWSTGIVSGGCGKRGNPSCRGGGAVACPSLEQGIPKKPLFCVTLQDVIVSSYIADVPIQEITKMEGG